MTAPSASELQDVVNTLLGKVEARDGANIEGNVRHSKEKQYWKSCIMEDCLTHQTQKGWIMIGPALQPRTAVEYTEFMEIKHATPLPKYGRAASGMMFDGPTRLVPLIEAGGINEIPIEQLTEYGWHRKPTMLKLLPMLEGLAEKDIICEEGCPTTGPKTRWFANAMEYNKHVSIMHKEAAAPKAIGREFSAAIAAIEASRTANPASGFTKEDLKAFAVAIAQALKE